MFKHTEKRFIMTSILRTTPLVFSSPKGKSKVAFGVYYVLTSFDIANRAIFLV